MEPLRAELLTQEVFKRGISAMATTVEGEHVLPDGTRLYTKTWKPSDLPPAAILVFVHGFSDHINAYYTLFPTLASRGIQTFGFDQRGWGQSVTSPATRGLTGPTSLVLADITSVIQAQLDQNEDNIPIFLMGHSMGGAQVLQYAARGPVEVRRKLRGYLAESPFIAFHKDAQPAWLTVVAGRLAARMMPKRQMVQKLNATAMSRDPKVCDDHAKDELCHDTGTLEGLAGLLERAEELEKGKVAIDDGEGVSIWAGHGTGDKVCSFEATQSLMQRLPVKDKQLRTYDGWFHKLHAEPGNDKITFANEVADWILARVDQGSDHSPHPVEEDRSRL